MDHERKCNGNFRHGGRTKETIEASRFISQLARLVLPAGPNGNLAPQPGHQSRAYRTSL